LHDTKAYAIDAFHPRQISKDTHSKQRAAFNASEKITNGHKELMNATAPLNLTQLHKLYEKDPFQNMVQTDAVNST